MARAVTDGFPLRHRWAEKNKIVWNPVKAPLWHKRKRNGPCVICLKRYSFVQAWRKTLFSAYAVVGTRSRDTRYPAMVSRRLICFYGKSYECIKNYIKKNTLKTSKESKSLGNLNKKVYLCNRVVRSSKAQHISEFAFSLNRYLKIAAPSFYSEFQSDISFLIIQCKDSYFSMNRHREALSIWHKSITFAAFSAKISVLAKFLLEH